MTTENIQTIRVSEVNGPIPLPTGILSGIPCYNLWLMGCDYACVWCDNQISIKPKNDRVGIVTTPQKLLERLDKLGGLDAAQWVLISGGNPALHKLGSTVHALRSMGYRLCLETQGTIYQKWMDVIGNIYLSPKGPSARLTSAQNEAQLEVIDRFIDRRYNNGYTYSSVDHLTFNCTVFGDTDLEYFAALRVQYPDILMYLTVGHIPNKDSTINYIQKYGALLAKLNDYPELQGTPLQLQLDYLVYGDYKQ